MSIPPRFLDDLRTRLTLSDVVGKKVKLTRAGREYKGCCPFHREKTPSFYVNDDKQFYHCFGCGAHGDVIGFTMAEGNLSFIEAIEQLAAQAGMQVPESRPEEPSVRLRAMRWQTFEKLSISPSHSPRRALMSLKNVGSTFVFCSRIRSMPRTARSCSPLSA